MVLARYIKVVMLTRNVSLWINDITIRSNGINVSCFKPTIMTLQHTVYDKDNAVDDSNVTIAGTKPETTRYSFWKVDLGDQYEIDFLSFTKRRDQAFLFGTFGGEIQFYTDFDETNLVHTLLLNGTNIQETFDEADLGGTPTTGTIPTINSVNGRVVKLQSGANGTELWITELEVYSNNTLISRNKCPSSTGTLIGNSADNAVDGKNNTFAGMYARKDRKACWQLDLGSLATISRIVFRGRDDVPPQNIYLRIYDNFEVTNLVFETKLMNNVLEQEWTEFTWTPDPLESLQQQVDDLQAYVDSLNIIDPLAPSGLTSIDVTDSNINTVINETWEYIFLDNTQPLGNQVEVEVTGSNLDLNNKGLKKNIIFNEKLSGASGNDNRIRVRMAKDIFVPPYPVDLSTIDYFYFDLRYEGSSLNLIWNGSKWFMLNPGNCVAKYVNL